MNFNQARLIKGQVIIHEGGGGGGGTEEKHFSPYFSYPAKFSE